MTVWFNDPRQLFKSTEILNFWPTSNQSAEERVNAASRFVIYASCFLYLIRRDVRVLVLGGMVLSVLYVIYKANLVKEYTRKPIFSDGNTSSCQRPTVDNPMANVLISDIGLRPNRPPACAYQDVREEVKSLLDDTIPYDAGRSRSPLPKYQQYASARQYVTGPVTTIPSDQTGFAESLYGRKFQPLCRDDPRMCNPDARGVQLEAFRGLDLSGDKRHRVNSS